MFKAVGKILCLAYNMVLVTICLKLYIELFYCCCEKNKTYTCVLISYWLYYFNTIIQNVYQKDCKFAALSKPF